MKAFSLLCHLPSASEDAGLFFKIEFVDYSRVFEKCGEVTLVGEVSQTPLLSPPHRQEHSSLLLW